MRKYITDPSRLYVAGTLALSILLGSCNYTEEVPEVKTSEAGLNVNVVEPVEHDYDEIKNEGVLRMITRYSSNTYFLHQGIEWGFEYELVNKFAHEHNLALEVVVIGPDENPYDLLNSGKGDIIAANYARTPERKKYVDFTRAYNLVDQLLVVSEEIPAPTSIAEFAKRDIAITVRRNSSYYYRLQELKKNGYDLSINLVSNKMDTESLLYDISQGKYMATIADNNIFQASNRYMKGIQEGPVIAKNDTIAWAIRKNAPNLKTQLNKFLYKHFRFGDVEERPKRSTFLNVLRKRYFKEGPQIADYYTPQSDRLGTEHIISPYDDLIKSVSDSAGVDWLMVASIIAQETKFNPQAKSWAGAVGLMQVLPRYSEVSSEELLYDEEVNLREGVRIIKEHLNHYSYMDSTDQWAFALAAYNAGQGHVADARRLVIDQNRNPNDWENASKALLKLMQRKYYKNARYGFCRGIETVRYVEEIKNRFETYEKVLALNQNKEGKARAGVLGIFN